jgi:hypothetical protein
MIPFQACSETTKLGHFWLEFFRIESQAGRIGKDEIAEFGTMNGSLKKIVAAQGYGVYRFLPPG